MMLARCPACQTVFRVRAEHLRAHHGDVRCGRCQTSFNALEHLLDENSKPAAAPIHATAPTTAETPDDATTGAARSAGAARPTAAAADRALDEQFFILEERPSDLGREGQQALPDFPAPPLGDEASATSDEPKEPLIGRAFDNTTPRLDFDIPDTLLPPRRPLRTSDLLRREPVIDEAGIERPTAEPGPVAVPPAAPRETSFPEFIDLSDLGPAEPSGSIDSAAEEPAHFAARVRFGEWAQRVRSEPDAASETDIPTEPPPTAERRPPSPPAADFGPGAVPFATTAGEAGAAEHETVIGDEVSAPDEVPPSGGLSPFPARADDALEAERLDAAYGPRPGRRWLLGLGIGVLLGALAVQSAYLFREEITRRWPQLRPAYLAACESFRCVVPLPRVADLIGIETSDLQSEPGRAGRFILNATVRNRAPHPQAYPHLELTLTDAQDRPVIRRVLEPKEWVPPRQLERAAVADDFRAGGEIALRLPFEAAGVAAVGYRLYVFYP